MNAWTDEAMQRAATALDPDGGGALLVTGGERAGTIVRLRLGRWHGHDDSRGPHVPIVRSDGTHGAERFAHLKRV